MLIYIYIYLDKTSFEGPGGSMS